MKKLLSMILFSAILAHSNAFASNQCRIDHMDFLDNERGEFIGDSQAFKLYDSELNYDFIDRPIEYAREAVSKLASEVSANKGENCNVSIRRVSCESIVKNNPVSQVCYIEADEGYFFLSMDMLDSVNIIFNRWD